VNNQLNSMVQGNEAFTTFLPKFEWTLAEAGGSDWADQVKINTLKWILSQELQTSLVYISDHPTAYHDFVRTLQTLASRLATLKPKAKATLTPKAKVTVTTAADEMDWEPSINKAQTPASNGEQKRAQWVTKEVLEGRKAANQCLHCGRGGHFISNCKLLPAQPPRQGKAKVKTMEVDDDLMIVELVEGSDTESGKE